MSAICREYLCSRVAVRRGLCRPHYDQIAHPLATGDPCDFCEATVGVVAYTLKLKTTSRGGVRLCESCWQIIAERRLSPEKRPHSTFRGLHWARAR